MAADDITPPAGIYARNWGAAAHEFAEGVAEPLQAAALPLRSAGCGHPLVLVSLDLGWWRDARTEQFVRGWLLRRLALPRSRLILALSHTHSGPVLGLDRTDQPGGTTILGYLADVRTKVLNLVQRALNSAKPATLDWAYGACDLAANRDLPVPGTAEVVCGFHPCGTADDTLLVGRVTAANGAQLATVVNYACHPTTLGWRNTQISPDYVGGLRSLVMDATGAPMLFLQGASGELAPREQYEADSALVRRHGQRLGHAVLSTLLGMLKPAHILTPSGTVASGAPLALWALRERTTDGALDARLTRCGLPRKPGWSVDEVEDRLARCEDRVERERLERRLRMLRSLPSGPVVPVPLWVWRLGEAFLVAQPNEAYSSLQVALRRRFGETAVAVVNCVNGPYVGYLPPREAYGDNRYQAWQTPLAPGCLERVQRAASRTVSLMAPPNLDA